MNMKIKLAHGFANFEKNNYGSYLHLVMVEPEYRGKGIATKLMRKVLDKAPRPIYLLTNGEFGSDPEMLVAKVIFMMYNDPTRSLYVFGNLTHPLIS